MGTTDMDKEFFLAKQFSYDRYLRALDDVLKEESKEYSILAREEWKTCLTCDKGQWTVSFVERGQDVKPEVFVDVKEACLRMIDSVSPKRKSKRIKRLYLSKVGTDPATVDTKSKFIFDLQKIAML